MQRWFGGFVMLWGCSNALEPGTATTSVTLTPSSDSSADPSPFVRDDTGTVSGNPERGLQLLFINDTRLRAFTFDLVGTITSGAIFTGAVAYNEVPGGVPTVGELWITDSEPTGMLTIESADAAG